jgi:hypothetical protein
MTVDKDGIHVRYDDGSTAGLVWDEVEEVGVVSMRRPVFGRDVFMLFSGAGSKALPILFDETPLNLLEEIHRLPGFDVDSPGRALQRLTTQTGHLVCWRREESGEHEPEAMTT